MVAQRKIRFAVVGLGHIAQMAVLPAFQHAEENCELTAVISDDAEKIDKLCKKYKVKNAWQYQDLDLALASNTFDAVYIALPNDLHKAFAIKAAQAGCHVLCEKPMALSEKDCMQMIEAAQQANVKLMIAYRLHFEAANMKVVEVANSGRIGKPKVFNSTFTMQVADGNIRTAHEHGGGPLYDIGIYCINAARYIFGCEPIEVMALMARSEEERFSEIEESIGAVMKFPGERLASFVCSFGAKDVSRYEVIGTVGKVSLEPAYDYAEALQYTVTVGDKSEHHKVPKHDQFAPELVHFAQSILDDIEPRPNGYEGLNDIRVIQAIRKSAISGAKEYLQPVADGSLPGPELIIEKPKVGKPKLVNAKSGSR
jgi:predicted dehydrogenase